VSRLRSPAMNWAAELSRCAASPLRKEVSALSAITAASATLCAMSLSCDAERQSPRAFSSGFCSDLASVATLVSRISLVRSSLPRERSRVISCRDGVLKRSS